MQKKLCFALSFGVWWLAESAPAGLGEIGFDKLDTDIANLRYDEDIDSFSKLLDETDNAINKDAKSKLTTSGFKKKTTANKGLESAHDIGDLKKFYKAIGAIDKGDYENDDIYGTAQGLAGKSVGIKGNEERKYRKGTKTRGFHRIHHKDEFKKDKLFYEDDETKGTISKVGAKGLGVKVTAGAGFDKGHFQRDHKKGIYGKQGFLDQ
ncbi:uncharacterized protein LOC101746708 [Bombyx mori]|uniref:Uncharacterized protein n=1 Tax=Bombyx mori TaxID=7091 RepID=A0A8R2ATT8_BOMMO|nr:uncharacterized protein LOC101746708 [Bombyx mori]